MSNSKQQMKADNIQETFRVAFAQHVALAVKSHWDNFVLQTCRLRHCKDR